MRPAQILDARVESGFVEQLVHPIVENMPCPARQIGRGDPEFGLPFRRPASQTHRRSLTPAAPSITCRRKLPCLSTEKQISRGCEPMVADGLPGNLGGAVIKNSRRLPMRTRASPPRGFVDVPRRTFFLEPVHPALGCCSNGLCDRFAIPDFL
jgi:hypothetical protein